MTERAGGSMRPTGLTGIFSLRTAPAVTLLAFLLPIAAGLIGTALPAFGYLPALGGDSFSLAPWRALLAEPALPGALRLSLFSGLAATALSLLLALTITAAGQGTRWFRRMQRALAPILAVPHSAMAIGLAFLIAPSGWLARLLSPWATGWELPPDLATLQDPWGLSLTLGLVMKETPYLLLMIIAALDQSQAGPRLALARSLGYGPVAGWIKVVLPGIYRQIRLPIYAVLAFSLSVVDVALILGPNTPPSLAVLVLRWFYDPDLAQRFPAAAGATLQLGVVVAAIALWHLGERLIARCARGWLSAGRRTLCDALVARLSRLALGGLLALAGGALLGILIWSLTRRWRYPDALPSVWSLKTWQQQADGLIWSGGTTLIAGLASSLIAIALTVACLEYEKRRGHSAGGGALWLLYLPLMIPQVSFLFGVQVAAIRLGVDGSWLALIWSHLLFVLPYTFLSLADPYRSHDERYMRAALCLGASPARAFWRVRLPMLLRPLLFSLAVGFAVSVAQYLPTLFGGAGRFVTLTTEAVGLAASGNRRVIAVYALLQALLPLLAFALALGLPNFLYRNRRLLRGT